MWIAVSPPARGRGLKLSRSGRVHQDKRSPPARGRGLKLMLSGTEAMSGHVAPRTGAWIETRYCRSVAQ